MLFAFWKYYSAFASFFFTYLPYFSGYLRACTCCRREYRPVEGHSCMPHSNSWTLSPNEDSHPRLPSRIFIYLRAELPQDDESLLVLLCCFFVVFNGLTDILLRPKTIFETLAQLELCSVIFHECSHSVVEECSFRHLWHPVSFLVHHSHEVVSLPILLIFGDDLPAIPV